MDAFEQVVAELVRAEGYWVRTEYKVTLTSEQKRDILRPSAPRWELDLVGYKPATNQLRVLECKSYLDSRGVDAAHFTDGAKLAGRYKLFHSDPLRDVILKALVLQLANEGLCRPDPSVARPSSELLEQLQRPAPAARRSTHRSPAGSCPP